MALPSDWGTTAAPNEVGGMSGGLSGGRAGPGLFGIGGANVSSQLMAQGINPYAGATIDPAAQAAWQQRQLALSNQLGTMAAGGGPSAAGATLAAGTNAAAGNALANANAGTRYGTNAAAGAYAAAANAANSESGAANQATTLRAQEQQSAIGQGASLATAGQQGQASLAENQAGLSEQAQLAQQALIANTYNQQTSTNANNATKLIGGLMGGGSGGASSLATMGAAKGALITKPVLTHLGEKGPEMVIPLKRSAAPYHPGKLAKHVSKHPPMRGIPPIPPSAVKPSAMARLAGRRPPAPAQPGAMPLSPAIAGVARAYMAKRPPPMAIPHAGR